MVNTVTQRTLYGSGTDRLIIRSIHIVSDGSEESDLVVYDNSTFMNNVAQGSLLKIQAVGSSCTCRLEWDQSTDAPVLSFDPSSMVTLDFSEFGGINNPAGSGATGDLLLTTANLDSGDEVSLILYIKQ